MRYRARDMISAVISGRAVDELADPQQVLLAQDHAADRGGDARREEGAIRGWSGHTRSRSWVRGRSAGGIVGSRLRHRHRAKDVGHDLLDGSTSDLRLHRGQQPMGEHRLGQRLYVVGEHEVAAVERRSGPRRPRIRCRVERGEAPSRRSGERRVAVTMDTA